MPNDPNIIKQSANNSCESGAPIRGSAPSPTDSQMSNHKIIKLLGDHEHNEKTKCLKIPIGGQVSGSPWTLLEQQALVVLVHDLGPNWELVSDAIKDILQFKYIYRNPKECKELYKFLMDRNEADHTEDSGSSQPHHSMLPDIPKGSAQLLFQRLIEPEEEVTLLRHFKKIKMLGQKLQS